MPPKVPALLEPHVPGVATEQGSLTVLTGVQGSTTNWLVLRYLVSLLQQQEQQQEDTGVVLASFMRDYAFWKDGATRLVSPWSSSRAQLGEFADQSGFGSRCSTKQWQV